MARLEFGKHRGKPLSEVPASYLQWCLDTLHNLTGYVRLQIRRELESRQGCHYRRAVEPEPAPLSRNVLAVEDVRELWSAVFRRLALVAHPDRGGTVRIMAELNECQSWMSEQLESVQQ